MSQMLTAPHIIEPLAPRSWLVYNHSIEDIGTERFNVRDTERGLNMDFMSYANWHLAQKDSAALLDPATLLRHSETTLQIFFKHFAATGTRPKTLSYTGDTLTTVFEDEERFAWKDTGVNGTLTTRVEVLVMNETATWLSLSIIFLLIVILVVLIVSLQVVYPSSCMQHHIECLADVLVLVAGSDELLRLVHGRGVEGLEKSGLRTRLGWFRDKRGVTRWGLEVEDAEGIKWVERPGKMAA